MNVLPEAIEAVKVWMSEEFPEAQVESGEIFDRVVMLFRASDDAGCYELEVTEEAFWDKAIETIVDDLREQDVAKRLRADPTMRLCYYARQGVPHFEGLSVTCDGRRYRVVRDSKHNVCIYDSSNRPLEGTPAGLRVMKGSVFRKQPEDWCDEIRSTRGENQ